ncbi:hypothetical protein [Pukyongiella litopenaei]|uniref:Uncharacterized protein n=1 Tax=Pukyongiella litopenaei TaxID=2605946 RepID=A0A2S0MLR0_9RHOB|nr:hypothetical protein [Pukyongiella litopenaei]AVO36814.1 hypothetical protein C6Y53_03315 [Pukyongiella litopenaei]
MTTCHKNRGGAPVGMVADLDPVEAGAVLYLRLWSDGPDGKARMWNEFASTLGAQPARAALGAFEDVCALIARQGRRAMMRHDVACRCLGADECCFAHLVAAAVDNQREDALLLATLLVRPDAAPGLVSRAGDFGLALKRIALRAQISEPVPAILH